MNIEKMNLKAAEVETLLKAMANRQRLMILCKLLNQEMSVSAIVQAIGLSQSAISQHLSVLRNDGLVSTRRESQTIYYAISNPHVTRIISLLYSMFCELEDDHGKAAGHEPDTASPNTITPEPKRKIS
jgi:DNA-binding transcriptional ArsR family regulator